MKINALACLATASLALSGCGRDDVQTYRVPKETTPQAAASEMPAGHPDISGASSATTATGQAPADWQEAPLGQMRVASYRVKGKDGKMADISVIPLAGMAGSDIDNVNRWRGQLGLEPASESDFNKMGEPVQVDGQDGKLYDLAGQSANSGEKNRMLAVIVRRPDGAWFFKMIGDDAVVGGQKSAFVDYVRSFSFSSSGAAMPDAQLPASHPPIGNNNAGIAASSTEGKPQWQVPAGWKETDAGQFLVAKFTISGSENSQATVNVSMSGGEGGGMLANVNRWRGQLGLNQLSQAEADKLVTSVDIEGGKAMLVDMSGADMKTGAKTRVVGAIVPKNQQTWFYKLMGPTTLVEQQKDVFTTFVQGVKYR